MKPNFTVVKILLFHGFFSWTLDVGHSTTSSPSASYSTIRLNSTRKSITTPALSSQNSTAAGASSSVPSLSPTSHRLRSSTSHWIPVATSRMNEATASPTSAKTSPPPTLGPFAAKLPLFAVISGILGFILLMLLIYIVWNLCLKDCSLSRVQPSVAVT